LLINFEQIKHYLNNIKYNPVVFYKLSAHPSKTLLKSRLIILYAFLLIDQKKSFAKEKSPADEKLPKFSTQLRQKFNSPSARTESAAADLLIAIAPRIFNGNFS